MISYIRGTLAEKDPIHAIVEAAGVGYEMLIPLSTYDRLPRTGEEVKLRTYHCVREDDESLFGFGTDEEREMFMKLVGVNGVGPKIALAMLSGLNVGDLALAIAGGEVKRLAAVKGVGKKTAEKICLELRDKVDALAVRGGAPGAAPQGSPFLRDATLTLTALGFGEDTVRAMIGKVLADDPSVKDVETLVRKALAVGR